MHRIFLSCLKATELIEKKLHFTLTSRERIQLGMHKMMCNACSLYEKQSELIEKGIEQQFEGKNNDIKVEELKRAINKKLHDNK